MLRTRLYLGLLPLLLILIGTGVYAIRVSHDLAGSLSRDMVNNYRAIFALQQMRDAARLMNAAAADAGRGDTLAARRQFDEQRAVFTRELMGQSASSVGSPRAALVQAVDEAFQAFVEGAEAQLRAGNPGSRVDVRQSGSALFRLIGSIETVTRRDAAAAAQIVAMAEERAATAERVLLTAIAGAVALSLFVAWRLAAALLKPIKLLTASAVAVGEGDLAREVPVLSEDELGQLARAFNTMAGKLREYREAMQARVVRTQRTMEATLTSAPDPVFVVDRAGRPEVRNPAAEQLGLAEFPPALAEALARVLATGEHDLPADYSRVVTLRVEREDRHYLPRILAIGDRLTEFKGAAVILQDVTKFRLLDDAKTNLVGTVSHELKSPLTSLRMAVYLLLEQKIVLTPTQRDLLETARDDADRLLRILDNLLDLARLEAGASALDRSEIVVAGLVEEIAAEARGFVEAAGARLVVDVEAATAAVELSLDRARIRHVFINLLTNAAKYSPAGGVVTLRASEEAGCVRFAVRDEGPGVAAESRPHVFDRFYRAPGQEGKSGAGLGLAIAREIVVAHGGSIACASEPGRGAEFYFLVPRPVSASSQ
ncbi:MAG: HAMP domain-containing protein [Verrucomicrobia bacterium]|nr:HAMP domain-containing protein [Verrucomicrobiota bacterium]